MPKYIRLLEICECPVCSQQHKFRLIVKREINRDKVLGLTIDPVQMAGLIRISRTFICPIKTEEFEFSFVIAELGEQKIIDVKVDGLWQDSDIQTDPDGVKDTSTKMLYEGPNLSEHEKVLLDTGKFLIFNTIEFSREFAKFMITICSALMPTYLGLLGFVGQRSIPHSSFWIVLYLLPGLCILTALLFFVLSYSPKHAEFSLDVISEIRRARNSIIKRRRFYQSIAIAFLVAGLAIQNVVLIIAYLY